MESVAVQGDKQYCPNMRRAREFLPHSPLNCRQGRGKDVPKTPLGSWAGLFPPPLLTMKRVVWNTLTGTMLGRKSRFLLSEAATGNKPEEHPPDKRNLFAATHALPCAPRGGTNGCPKEPVQVSKQEPRSRTITLWDATLAAAHRHSEVRRKRHHAELDLADVWKVICRVTASSAPSLLLYHQEIPPSTQAR